MKHKFDELKKEYSDFLEDDSINPPTELSSKVLAEVYRKLHPNAWLIFSKLSLLHFFSGMITLSVCPQFGINIFGTDLGLLRIFYKLGIYGCTMACGSLFISVTTLLAILFLRPEEIKKIRQLWLLQVTSICLLTLGFFIMLNAEIIWSFALSWIIGGLLGSLMMLEAGIFVQKRILARI